VTGQRQTLRHSMSGRRQVCNGHAVQSTTAMTFVSRAKPARRPGKALRIMLGDQHQRGPWMRDGKML